MKLIFSMLIALFFFKASTAQQTISITTGETTSLIFPAEIKHIDRGSPDLLVHQPKDATNMLLIKAARLFTPTNLSVVAANGQLFSIPVVYAEKPLQTVYTFDSTAASSAIMSKENVHDLKDQVLMIMDNKAFIHRSVAKDLVGLRLKGIYIARDHFLFSFQFNNGSNIGYDVEQFRLYIKDKRTAKRTSSQETDLHPQFLTGTLNSIGAQESKTFIISCPKFTIPDAKKTLIQLDEKNGGRHLKLVIRNKQLLKALPLP